MLTNEDWQKAAGTVCDGCGLEKLRLFKVCPECISKIRSPEEVMGLHFPDSGWEVVNIYHFSKRTTYIYRHKVTGEERAYDILKGVNSGGR